MPERRPSIPWHLPPLLALPALFPFAWSWWSARSRGLVFTGFIQYDLPYYLANARQHFANGFQWTYSNPYAPYGSPAIYFQPQTFLWAVLQRVGLSPALALNLFGLCAMVFAATAAARLYEELVGWETASQKIGFLCFFWGGGVLSLAGVVVGAFTGVPLAKASMFFDAGDGWWMFNFGRNLVYPHEAYYHGLFLLTLWMLIRGRRGWALSLTALMALSHPFTGLSLSLIVAAFSVVEAGLGSGPWKMAAGAGAVVAAHAGYYLVFLNRFADHRALRQQWELDWPYLAWTFVPAVYIVGFLAFTRISRWKSLKAVLEDARMRLFLVCFAVVFGLSHHDALVKPVQPLHFTHGYDWIALFFLASPVLIRLIDKLQAIRAPALRYAALAGFLLLMFSDNLLWFASFRDTSVQRYAIALTPDEDGVLRWLERNEVARAEVVSADDWIGYLTATYTDMRSWYGHVHNTPHAAERKNEVEEIFQSAAELNARRPVFYIPRREALWTPPENAREVYRNGSFVIWRRDERAGEELLVDEVAMRPATVAAR